MGRAVLAVCVAALVCASASAGARVAYPPAQEVAITGDGGVQLSCGFVLPTGTPPDGGWPGVVLFPGGESHYSDENLAGAYAMDGFAAVTCDERGMGDSGGSFDLAGPEDAADAQHILDWLAARPEVSDTQIGAYGVGLGGAEVWDAAVHDVPFKAIVPVDAWSSLDRLLHPSGGTDVLFVNALTAWGPPTWNTPSGIAARSYRGGIPSLTVPTLLEQRRAPYLVDLSQATAPYRLLAGPKHLVAYWDTGLASQEALAWFQEYLAGGPTTVGPGVEIQHAKPDASTTTFPGLPPTRSVSVNLPGASLARHVWLAGGPFEMFGGGSVTIRYSNASWKQVVVEVVTGKGALVGLGAMQVTQTAGVMKIPLMRWMAFLPGRTKLNLRLTSHDSTFGGTHGGKIAVGRVTLRLSVLERAVSH